MEAGTSWMQRAMAAMRRARILKKRVSPELLPDTPLICNLLVDTKHIHCLCVKNASWRGFAPAHERAGLSKMGTKVQGLCARELQQL